jgi:hypothetical protein
VVDGAYFAAFLTMLTVEAFHQMLRFDHSILLGSIKKFMGIIKFVLGWRRL